MFRNLGAWQQEAYLKASNPGEEDFFGHSVAIDGATVVVARAAGHDVARVYYYGESVLLPGWRGRGIGVAFFAAREARARELGFKVGTFCAVVRPDNHPLRPADGYGRRGSPSLDCLTSNGVGSSGTEPRLRPATQPP